MFLRHLYSIFRLIEVVTNLSEVSKCSTDILVLFVFFMDFMLQNSCDDINIAWLWNQKSFSLGRYILKKFSKETWSNFSLDKPWICSIINDILVIIFVGPYHSHSEPRIIRGLYKSHCFVTAITCTSPCLLHYPLKYQSNSFYYIGYKRKTIVPNNSLC